MYDFSIGVMLDSFRTGIAEALDQAVAVGAEGIQVYTTTGELSAAHLTPTKRREFLRQVQGHGLSIAALCGDLGQGFGDAQKNPQLIEDSKRILDLAKDLETDIVTTHIGVVPSNPQHARYQIMQEACFQLSRYADSLQAHFAIETGPEPAAVLKEFLDNLNSTGVAVNLDPANFVMVTGDDPVAAVYTLQKYIVHTHAKDGRRLRIKDPEKIYGILADSDTAEPDFIELPLGEGDVDFANYLKALHEIGYHGFLTVEREAGAHPAEDIAKAVAFLRRWQR